MSTPAQKLSWDDLDPADRPAAEANAAAARARVQSAVKEDKAATRAGTHAGMGYKLSWDDLTPVEGSRQQSRVTPSNRPPSTWGQGDTSPINRAPRSGVRPAATASGGEGLAQPGAIAQTDFASRVLTSPKVPRSPSFAEDATARGARVNPSTSGVNAGKGMLMAPPPGGSVTPAGVGGAPDVMRRPLAITQRELDRQMKHEMRPYRNERLRQENQSGGPEATLYNAATGLAKVGARGLGFIGRVTGNEDLQDYATEAQEHAEDVRAAKGSDTFAGNIVHGGAQLAPALVVPGGPVGFGAFEASQALGEGEPLPEAIKRGVEAGVTAHLGGAIGKTLTRPLARAPEAFAARVAGNVAAPVGVRAATTGQVSITPEDIAFGTVMSIPGGRAQSARRTEALRTAPMEARAKYEAARAAEESAPLYPRVNVAPTEKGVESAISTQLGTRQPLSSPRLVPRTTVQPQAESAVRAAPASPAPSQAAQRGDFETGLEGMTTQPVAPRVAPSASPATSAPEWVKQNIEALTAGVEKSGVADRIEELSAQRKTAQQVGSELGIEKDIVRAVRAKRGIPSMDDADEFNQWLGSRQSRAKTRPVDTPDDRVRATIPQTSGVSKEPLPTFGPAKERMAKLKAQGLNTEDAANEMARQNQEAGERFDAQFKEGDVIKNEGNYLLRLNGEWRPFDPQKGDILPQMVGRDGWQLIVAGAEHVGFIDDFGSNRGVQRKPSELSVPQAAAQAVGEGKVTTVRPSTPRSRSVSPESDTLLAAIQKLGFDATTAEGSDLAKYLSVKEGGRPGMVNNQRGAGGQKRSIDDLVGQLQALGYPVEDGNHLLDLVRQEQQGKPTHSYAYDHAAKAESDLQQHLSSHSEPVQQKVTSFVDGLRNHSEFAELSDKIAHGEATDEETKRFAEIGRYELNIDSDALESFLEESQDVSGPQGRGAQLGVERSQSSQRPQERGTVRDAAAKEGNVDGPLYTDRPRSIASDVGSAGNIEPPAARKTSPTVDGIRTESSAPTADRLSRVQSIFDTLKDESRTTGRRLTDIVEDRIKQQALPGMESAALSESDATLLRQMATRTPNRPPVQEQQSSLLDTAPTVESRQAQTVATEDAQSRGAANAPLFEGVKAEGEAKPTRDEFIEQRYRTERGAFFEETKNQTIKDLQNAQVQLEQAKTENKPRVLKQQERVVDMYEKQLEALMRGKFPDETSADILIRSRLERMYDDEYPHHSHDQSRANDGTFTIDKPKVAAFHRQLLESGKSVDQYLSQPELFGDELTDGERDHLRELGEPARQAIAEHGQFARFLFHASERGKGDAFLGDPAVKRALNLPDSANLTTVHNRLRAELGMETNRKVSPEALYGWAADKQLPHGAVEKIKRAEDSALEKAAAMAARRKSEGGFIRFGGTGSSKQTDLGDLFGKRDRIPVDEAAHAFESDWEDFEPMPGKANAPRAGEAYYEQGEAKRKDKIASLRTLDLWMKANMLMGASPYSHKVGSLLSNIGAEVASSPGGALADFIVSKSTGRNRQYLIDPRGLARAAAESVTSGAKQAAEILKNGATREQIEQFGKPTELNTRSPIVNAMVNYTFRAYKAGAHIPGMFHYERAMSMQAKALALEEAKAGMIGSHEVSQRQAEILDGNGVPEGQMAVMEGNALLAYADGVFQSDNALNNVRRRLMNEASQGWQFAINRVVPFMKSASNAYLKMLDYTGVGPKGAVMESYRAVARKVRSGEAFRTDADQTAFSSAWGKLPVGIALFAAGAALHRNGLMTSLIYHHDDNPQPGSVRALGKLIDVARYSPIGLIMAAGATYDELTGSKGDDPLTAAVKTAGEGASNLPMFQQTNDLIKTATALSEGKTSVPGVMGAIGKAAVTRTLPTMVPGYATVRDVVKGVTDDRYAAGPIGKMLHIQNEVKAPRSNDESAIHSAYRAANPLPPMTPLQKTKFDAKKEIETAIQRGDTNTSDIIKRNVDAGLVNDDEVFDLAATAHKSKQEVTRAEFKKLDLERMLDLFPTLSKSKRDEFKEDLEDKWADSAMKMTAHERAVLGPRVGQALQAQ